MTPHGACLTPSLQQGWVTIPVMYQQPYQTRGLYGNPPQPSHVYVLPPPDNTQQITEALAKVTQLHRLPQAKPAVFIQGRRRRQDKILFVGICL